MSPTKSPHRIGELCVGGDWACAHGDIEALGFVAKELAVRGPAHLRTTLTELAEECTSDPAQAAIDWPRLKAMVAKS